MAECWLNAGTLAGWLADTDWVEGVLVDGEMVPEGRRDLTEGIPQWPECTVPASRQSWRWAVPAGTSSRCYWKAQMLSLMCLCQGPSSPPCTTPRGFHDPRSAPLRYSLQLLLKDPGEQTDIPLLYRAVQGLCPVSELWGWAEACTLGSQSEAHTPSPRSLTHQSHYPLPCQEALLSTGHEQGAGGSG